MMEDKSSDKFLFVWSIKEPRNKIFKINLRIFTIITCALTILAQIPSFALIFNNNIGEILIAVFNGLVILAFVLVLYAAITLNAYLAKLGNTLVTCLNYVYTLGGLALTFFLAYFLIPAAVLENRRNNNLVGDPFIYGPMSKNTLLYILLVSWLLGLIFSICINYVTYSFQNYTNKQQIEESPISMVSRRLTGNDSVSLIDK